MKALEFRVPLKSNLLSDLKGWGVWGLGFILLSCSQVVPGSSTDADAVAETCRGADAVLWEEKSPVLYV